MQSCLGWAYSGPMSTSAPSADQFVPAEMTAVAAEHSGGPEVLQPVTRPVPEPGPGQLLVRTRATGVNFIETYQRSGVYPVEYPFIPGAEAAGEIVAVGPGVGDDDAAGAGSERGVTAALPGKVGQRVVTAQAQAAYAEYHLVDAAHAVLIPEEITDQQAAALALQGMTAHYLLRSTYPVASGETILFHAGAGGVGGLAIQLAKQLGARVITTVSTDEKEQIAAAHGADHVLRYEGFAEQVRELTDDAGVDVVYDSVGRDTFEDSLRTLRPRGTAVLFGGASGQVPPFDLQRLNALGALYVTRPTLNPYIHTREELTWRMGELFDAVAAGRLRLSVDQTFPLKEAKAAHEYLEARRTRGKVLLLP